MNELVPRFYALYYDLDPRDRRNALWRVSGDVYDQLCTLYPGEPFPDRLRGVDELERAPEPETPGLMLGIEVTVDTTLPPGSVTLDVDDAITRAIKRAERQGLKHVTILPPPKFEMPPMPPPPDVTFKALVRKWCRKSSPMPAAEHTTSQPSASGRTSEGPQP